MQGRDTGDMTCIWKDEGRFDKRREVSHEGGIAGARVQRVRKPDRFCVVKVWRSRGYFIGWSRSL